VDGAAAAAAVAVDAGLAHASPAVRCLVSQAGSHAASGGACYVLSADEAAVKHG
jgi:hypothetical protein